MDHSTDHPTSGTICPACQAEVPASAINVNEAAALCPACGELFQVDVHAEAAAAEANRLAAERLDELAAGTRARPPRGCRVIDRGSSWRVYAVIRNWSLLPILPMAVIFSSVTVGVGIKGGGDVMFVFMFGLASTALSVVALLMLLGRVEVRCSGGQGVLFIGVGPIGVSRRFDTAQVREVKFVKSQTSENGRPVPDIALTGTGIAFGSLWLSNDRKRAFMAAELRKRLVG